MKTISSREFNQDTSGAKRAASKAPVVITDRGAPAFVLMSVAQFRALSGGGESGLDVALRINQACPTDFEWEPPRLMTGNAPAAAFD